MIQECDVCGGEFHAAPRQKRHKECARYRPSKNNSRTVSRAAHALEFIGVDGEGVTYCVNCLVPVPRSMEEKQAHDKACNELIQKHDYVLLSVGDQSYSRPDDGHLHWREIFMFLYDQFLENPHAVFGGYYLGYDFAQWVRTMPEDRGRMLFDKKEIAKRRRSRSGGNTVPFPVYIDEWECDILPGRRFKIRPSESYDGKPHQWMYICDAGSFFQRSFLSAIDPEDWPVPIVSPEDFALIKEGKERRAVATLDDAMKLYNIAENRAFSSLMGVLNNGFVKSGIKLKKDQWYGPGQAAQGWLNLIQAPTSEQVREVVPQAALDAARAAYYGGWFEIFCHGHIPGVSYENDEISSYPHTISQLPCLLHGEWETGTGIGPIPHPDHLRLVHAEIWGSDPHVGTMLHRTPHGTILRPHHTAGWYWWHELEASLDAGLIDHIEATEWVNYTPCECPPPLSGIRDLFELRKQVGKNTPQGKALKLVYNSVYGKTAQSIGSPRYANAIWASLITSWTRTRLVKAIATHPNGTSDLLMAATDGIYFRTPHPHLEFSKDKLGKWELEEKHNLTLFMPGMYWDDKTRDQLKIGKAPKLKSRGVSAKALGEQIEEIDGQFRDIINREEWPKVDLQLNMLMISPGQALQRGDWNLCGAVVQSLPDNPIVRTVYATPITKRPPYPYMDNDIMRTIPYSNPPFGPIESKPYDGTFGEPNPTFTPEGDMMAIIAEMLLH